MALFISTFIAPTQFIYFYHGSIYSCFKMIQDYMQLLEWSKET